jgi:hypothetical protein
MRATKRQTEAVRAYVEDQAHEAVVHLEKAASERAGGAINEYRLVV